MPKYPTIAEQVAAGDALARLLVAHTAHKKEWTGDHVNLAKSEKAMESMRSIACGEGQD